MSGSADLKPCLELALLNHSKNKDGAEGKVFSSELSTRAQQTPPGPGDLPRHPGARHLIVRTTS